MDPTPDWKRILSLVPIKNQEPMKPFAYFEPSETSDQNFYSWQRQHSRKMKKWRDAELPGHPGRGPQQLRSHCPQCQERAPPLPPPLLSPRAQIYSTFGKNPKQSISRMTFGGERGKTCQLYATYIRLQACSFKEYQWYPRVHLHLLDLLWLQVEINSEGTWVFLKFLYLKNERLKSLYFYR